MALTKNSKLVLVEGKVAKKVFETALTEMDKMASDWNKHHAKAKEFLHSLHGKHIVLFETMGADPRSEHAYTGFANAGTALPPDNQIVGVFAVQGAVDPALLAMMRKMPEGSAHHSAQMEQTVKEAAKHPNAEDLKQAEKYMKQFIETYSRYHH